MNFSKNFVFFLLHTAKILRLLFYSSDFNTTCFNWWMEIAAVFYYNRIDGLQEAGA